MDTTDREIIRRLEYNPISGILTWKSIPSTTREDKIYNTRNAGKVAGCFSSKDGYYRVRVCGVLLLSHRVAWFLHYGSWPSNLIDHINHIRTDNSITNLRDVERAVQARNTYRRKTNKSGYTGVFAHSSGRGWCAEIQQDGLRIYLGYFTNKHDAVHARKEAQDRMDFSDTHGGQCHG